MNYLCQLLYYCLKKIAKSILLKCPIQNIIVYESIPDFSCNTYPVFLELRKRLPQYKMIWMTLKETPICSGVDDVIFSDCEGIYNKLKRYYYRSSAKVFVSCNKFRKMGSLKEGQISLFLAHGSKTKKTRRKDFDYCPGQVVDYVNIQSHFFDEITCYEYNAKKEQLVYLGYPRCDWFYVHNDIKKNLSKIGVDGDFLIWLPTFRKHKTDQRDVHSDKYDNMGMPLIYSTDKLLECNSFLAKRNLHIIFKPHPVQDISNLKKEKLSHIHVINDKVLSEIDVQLYQVIAESKALISDYSSVYFDYLLLDRPIATTIDDIEQWKEGEGFAYDVEDMYKVSTEQIANLDDFYSFVQNVVIDKNDKKSEARKKICKKTIMYRDGKSAIRVADFIISKIEEK